jgi:hypothetical protein
MGTLIFDHLYLLEILTTSQSCSVVFSMFSVCVFSYFLFLCLTLYIDFVLQPVFFFPEIFLF